MILRANVRIGEMKFERYRTKELPHESEKGEREEGNEDGDITRREFVTRQVLGGAATIAASAGVVAYANRAQGESAPRATARPEVKKHHESPPRNPDWWKSVAYATPKDLVGKPLNPLEVAYVRPIDPLPAKDEAHPDIPVCPPTFGPIDFGGNLKHLFARKRERLTLDTKNMPKDYDEQIAAYERLQASYQDTWERNEIRRMNMKQFEHFIAREISKTLQALEASYPAIVKEYIAPFVNKDDRLDEAGKRRVLDLFPNYLSYLAKNITAPILLSYITTEIMPSTEKGAALLEFITKNAGVEYLEKLPSLGDKLLSYGPFQLTKFVVDKGQAHTDENGKVTYTGQGSVTELLRVVDKSDMLPESLADFDSIEQHIRAGQLFAFTNALQLIRDIAKSGEYERIAPIGESAYSGRDSSNTVFIEQLSAAHHRPVVARKAMSSWIDANKELPEGGREKTLADHFPANEAGQQVRLYAERARENSAMVNARLRA